ncbi:MAG: UrcA family protein [Pseudomonadota bacterium]
MRTFIVTLASLAAAIAVPAAASETAPNATDFATSIDHSDLDLSTDTDASRLDERVRTNIRKMCRNGGRDSDSIRLERQCRKSALASAQPGVNVAIANAKANAVARQARLALNTAAPASSARPLRV